MKRNEVHGLPKIELLERPLVDLYPIGLMMNGGNFKGSGLDNITRKQGSGFNVLEMHSFGDYDRIEEYIKQEAKAYIDLYVWLKKRMPELLKQFKEERGLN